MNTPGRQLRIGLWGAPGSGKTTFLAALAVAAARHPGAWVMSGVDEESAGFLRSATDLLTSARRFPESTAHPTELRFRFTGQREVPRRTLFRRVVDVENVSFELEVLDVPGSLFSASSIDDHRSDSLVDHLENCDGIVYLLDPEQEARQQDSFRYFHPIAQQLMARIMSSKTYSGTRLPQPVAVCLTKFDQPTVYRTASLRGFTVHQAEPPYQPVVPNELAADFYGLLVEHSANNTDLLDIGLRNYFSEVQYFVTSAIGFHMPGVRFQPADHLNVQRVGPGPNDFTIRGKISPINVFEPLLWLYDTAQATRPS